MTELATNVLYYGDNLDILRGYLPDASVDLIYLDPPFNSNRDYNVIFRDESGSRYDAQLLARNAAGRGRTTAGEPSRCARSPHR
jgi:DNA modification methylase